MYAYLKPTLYFDYQHPLLQEFVQEKAGTQFGKREKVVQLYYAIRDGWRYNPYPVNLSEESFKASTIFKRKEGHCVDKAILMVACCRALDVPSRIGFAKVINHIGTEKLEKKLRTNILVPHGYVEIYLNDEWVKATPAFNKELCQLLHVAPLDFDGKIDSVFQEFDKKGGVFMKYLEDWGTSIDFSPKFFIDTLRAYYPDFFKDQGGYS